MIELKGGAFGGHESGTLMNRINALALTRETPGAHYLLPSTIRGHSKQLAVYEPGNGLSPDTKSTSTMILDFQPLDL